MSGLSRDEEKLTFFGEDKGTIYQRLVTLLHRELHRADEALAYVERARSRVFLELLARGQISVAQKVRTEAPLSFPGIIELLT